MKKITLILMLLAAAFNLKAQDVTGDWYGAIKVAGAKLNLVFHINKSGDGYSTVMDSPDQGAKGLATDKTTVNNNAITIEANKFGIKFTGTYKPNSSIINGTFTQGALNTELILTHTTPKEQGKRPQDPTTFPYKQEEVTIPNTKTGNTIAGTLTIPSSGNVSKIVVLITGSGPQNRNEELQGMDHRPFLVLSDWLTRNGIAVLRYDDRGVGKSTGNFAAATTADFADDTEAAVKYIQVRPDLNKLSIGLIGHSEGGMIAPMVAARNNAVKFICLLAAPGVPMTELGLQQQKDQLRMAGTAEEAMKLSTSMVQNVFKTIVDNPQLSNAALKAKVDTVLLGALSAFPPKTFAKESKQDMANKITTQFLSAWYRYALSLKPADYLTQIKCPVLAINGTLDIQVENITNLAAIKAALQTAGNKNHEEVALTGLNHLFQKAKTGSMNEYAEIEETFNPVALEKVSTWINGLGF
ncbi:alpha/beta hydrolase family protein [Mucilaginibacter sp. HD30]